MKTYKKSNFIKLNDTEGEFVVNKNEIMFFRKSSDVNGTCIYFRKSERILRVNETYDEVFKMLVNDNWYEVKSIHDIQSPGTSTIKYPDEV